ncbi:MAG: SDR family oxidoreductase [Chloroflexota bacterium]|nr:MAG: SDR family oxidoreductase [Chloroflexota bacterium]
MGRLTGKIAIVTGAGTGMGRAITRALAEEGATITIAGRRHAALDETISAARDTGADITAISADVSKWTEVERLVQMVIARWGHVDLLVNNAGTNTKRRSYTDATLDDWDSVVRTNLDGVYFCTRAVLPSMRARKSGQIINISSMAGRQASVMSGVAYSASKHGVVALTQSTNLEEWRNGIRATCIEPGEVATPILELRPDVPPRETWKDMLQAEDIGEAVRFLATLPDRVLIDEMTIRPRIRRMG